MTTDFGKGLRAIARMQSARASQEVTDIAQQDRVARGYEPFGAPDERLNIDV